MFPDLDSGLTKTGHTAQTAPQRSVCDSAILHSMTSHSSGLVYSEGVNSQKRRGPSASLEPLQFGRLCRDRVARCKFETDKDLSPPTIRPLEPPRASLSIHTVDTGRTGRFAGHLSPAKRGASTGEAQGIDRQGRQAKSGHSEKQCPEFRHPNAPGVSPIAGPGAILAAT